MSWNPHRSKKTLSGLEGGSGRSMLQSNLPGILVDEDAQPTPDHERGLRADKLEGYSLPAFNAAERAAIDEAVPQWVAANLYGDGGGNGQGFRFRQESASDVLDRHGIRTFYKRGKVRFCHIETEIRVRATMVIKAITDRKGE